MASSDEVDDLLWAKHEARRLLEPLEARWRHTMGVVERAREVASVLPASEAAVLVAAAFAHDVGYAPELRVTGFHPLDGARLVRESGHERLAGLVAYHCSAEAEASERGLQDELAEFVDERSAVSRALAYCDLTTDSEGRRVDVMERLSSIRGRYGAESPEVRALERSLPALLDDVRMVESMLAADALRTEAGGRGPRR
jgi:hypothetical protein